MGAAEQPAAGGHAGPADGKTASQVDGGHGLGTPDIGVPVAAAAAPYASVLFRPCRGAGVTQRQRPPSTSRVTPVIIEASSEHRKQAALPMSSGVEKRPIGMVDRNLAQCRWDRS